MNAASAILLRQLCRMLYLWMLRVNLYGIFNTLISPVVQVWRVSGPPDLHSGTVNYLKVPKRLTNVQLAIIGTHQRNCPVVMRERLAFGAETIREALLALREYVDEGFIISTCNRVEVGGLVADGPAGVQALKRFLADWHHVPLEHLAPHLYTFSGADAVQHLFRLAAFGSHNRFCDGFLTGVCVWCSGARLPILP